MVLGVEAAEEAASAGACADTTAIAYNCRSPGIGLCFVSAVEQPERGKGAAVDGTGRALSPLCTAHLRQLRKGSVSGRSVAKQLL